MKRRISFLSDTSFLAEVRAGVRSFLEDCRIEECEGELLVLALDEACTNVIRHAYKNERKPIRLDMEKLRHSVRFTLRDYGKPCDPKNIRGRDLEDIRPGGVGVHIIRQAFDRVEYSPQAKGTRLVLEKDFKQVVSKRPSDLADP